MHVCVYVLLYYVCIVFNAEILNDFINETRNEIRL